MIALQLLIIYEIIVRLIPLNVNGIVQPHLLWNTVNHLNTA